MSSTAHLQVSSQLHILSLLSKHYPQASPLFCQFPDQENLSFEDYSLQWETALNALLEECAIVEVFDQYMITFEGLSQLAELAVPAEPVY